MKRREFMKVTGIVLGTVAVTGGRALAWALPRRYLRAVKSGSYPGQVRPLDYRKILKQGKWSG